MKILPRFLATVATVALLASNPVSARQVPLDALTVADINAAFAAGTLTSEKLVELTLARIAAYDEAGPRLNAVMALNPNALAQARALDAERKAKGPRSPMHGIPVVLKDNFDTVEMPTTGGSILLEGNVPPDDAYMVKRLRDAGAIILAKVNLSEFAAAGTNSSLGGQSKNPHNLLRSPAGSSGGSGVAIAANFGTVGFGTDTGGSIRGPSTANGIVGLKPTHGLLSRDGIIPLALSFDTGGPMTRSVTDIAAVLGTMTGVDPADDATKKSAGKFEKDYMKFLNANALKGARIGIARDFMGQDEEVDFIIENALHTMRAKGATIVDVRYPKWLLSSMAEIYTVIRWPEFPVQMNEYLKTTGPKYPKSVAEMLERARAIVAPRPDGAGPNTTRWLLFERELASGSMTDYKYTSMKNNMMPLVREIADGILASNKLDAYVYPTSPRRPGTIAETPGGGGGGGFSGTNYANLSGNPDLIVPAGFTNDDLPVGMSFFGTAFSEPKLIALAYSFEQASQARRLPVTTPNLAGEMIEVPERK